MVKIIGIGDNVVDKYIHMGTMYPGGNALNIAVLCKRYGAETAYLGCLGNDYAGKHIYEYKLKYSKQWIRITTLNINESKILKVKEHTPAFLLESITYDMDDRIVEATRSLNIGDRTTFYTELWPNGEV